MEQLSIAIVSTLIGVVGTLAAVLLTKWLSEPTWMERLARDTALTAEEYSGLHPRWRQVVADVIVNMNHYTKDVASVIRKSNRADYDLLEVLARHTTGDLSVVDGNVNDPEIPGLPIRSRLRLVNLGVLAANRAVTKTRTVNRTENGPGGLLHILYMGPLVLRANNGANPSQYSLTGFPLTEEAMLLIALREAHPDPDYVKLIVSELEKQGHGVLIWNNIRSWEYHPNRDYIEGPVLGYRLIDSDWLGYSDASERRRKFAETRRTSKPRASARE